MTAQAASSIGQTAATANGTLTTTGTSATVVQVLYGPADMGETTNGWAATNDCGTVTQAPPVAFATNLTPLVSGQAYYYRYYARNATGPSYSLPVLFRTLGPPEKLAGSRRCSTRARGTAAPTPASGRT